jgi:hypothetical protein
MAGLELFQRMTVEQVAKWLELHPFEIVRILVADGSLPADLRLDASNVERVRAAGGLETWWEGPPPVAPGQNAAQATVRQLLLKVLDKQYVEPRTVRADNLFRGLDAEHQRGLRRAVNALIREGVLISSMSATGLTVAIAEARSADARQFAAEGTGPVSHLWDQD